jgi:predicted nucleic acid-binding protein
MSPTNPKPIPRVFVDADVLFAGSASPSEHSASQVILRMAEITLIEAFISEQVLTEVERNLSAKLPQALPNFRHLVNRCLQIVPDPTASLIKEHHGKADPKDLPILVAAAREKCSWLVTFNSAHFQPGLTEVAVLQPGNFILLVRDLLMQLI